MDYPSQSYLEQLLEERKKLERDIGMRVIHECKNPEYAKEEVWDNLIDANNVYVSSFGRMLRQNKTTGERIMLTEQKSYKKTGRLRINGMDVRPHILVAKYFGALGKGIHVIHINGDKDDNVVDNLRYVSKSEASRSPIISREYTTTFPLCQFTPDGIFVRQWNNISEVVEATGYRGGDILMCAEGETFSAHGYVWVFSSLSPENDVYPKIGVKIKTLSHYLITGIYDNKSRYLFPTISEASEVSNIPEIDIMRMCVLCEPGDKWIFSHKGMTINKEV